MNNQPYNQRPGYYAPSYPYNYQPPYNIQPYPMPTPYGMPAPMPTAQPPAPMPAPMPNYVYYAPPVGVPPDMPPTFVAVNPMYPVQYSQTRMASPSPYAYPAPPAYNYSTTNMISRPPRPIPTIYPQLNQNQAHSYPPVQQHNPANVNFVNNSTNNNVVKNNNIVNQAVVKPEPVKDRVESSSSSRKLSEVSIVVSVIFCLVCVFISY